MTLLRWLSRILKKWIWVLGFVPLILDYISTYIPTKYVPLPIWGPTKDFANWQFTGILVVICLLGSAFLVHREDEAQFAKERREMQQRIDSLQADPLTEAAVHLSLYYTLPYNVVTLKYVLGKEPIEIVDVTMSYVGIKGNRNTETVQQFYALNDHQVAGHQISLSVLQPNEGGLFHAPQRDDVKDGKILVEVSFSGLKTGKKLSAKNELDLLPNPQSQLF